MVTVSHHDATPASGNIEHHIIGRDSWPWRFHDQPLEPDCYAASPAGALLRHDALQRWCWSTTWLSGGACGHRIAWLGVKQLRAVGYSVISTSVGLA